MKVTTNVDKDYKKLLDLSREAKTLEGVASLLSWDAETYMPPGAAPFRSEQRELLVGLAHELRVSRKYRAALGSLLDLKTGKTTQNNLSSRQKAALREWHRDYRIATALPTAFVKNFTKLTSDACIVWRTARTNSDFKSFSPWLERIIVECRKKADFLGYQEHPYDALLDLFEPNITSKEVSKLFGTLKTSIVPLLQRIRKAKQVNCKILHGHYTDAQQLQLADKILKAIGYDMNHGRLDISTHPFSNATHPTDSRITTRLEPTDPTSSLLSVLHECGHGLYEQGLPTSDYGSPLGEPVSLGIHESQSRFWETRIGRSKAFWTFCLPIYKKVFAPAFKETKTTDIFRAVNKVEPSYIRVEADEVTYSLHVILRFELEKALIEGSLKVSDLPDAWSAKMTELLGITPPDDARGCLQDIHWSLGAFGYFPSYSLGNMYAAMLFEAFEKAFPNWQKEVEKGHFAFIREWLTDHVHQHGRRYCSSDLLKKVNGKKITAEPYTHYLETKYKDVYALK